MKVSLGLLAYILPLATSAWKPRPLARQEALASSCPTQYTIEYDFAPSVIGQPVEVITSITSNTTLTPLPFDVPITISNAPTLLSTVVTAYSTTTVIITRRYVTLTTFYPGAVISTSTLLNTAGPEATTTYLVLVPSQGPIASSPPLNIATPSSLGISQVGGSVSTAAIDLPWLYDWDNNSRSPDTRRTWHSGC
jgi:hypothetical protein